MLRPVQVFSCEISLVCHLKCAYSCFSSHFCFLVYFRSVNACVACIISGRCHQSSSELFYVLSMHQRYLGCWWVLLLHTCSLSISSLRYKALCIVMSFVFVFCSLVHILFVRMVKFKVFLWPTLRMVPNISLGKKPTYLSLSKDLS